MLNFRSGIGNCVWCGVKKNKLTLITYHIIVSKFRNPVDFACYSPPLICLLSYFACCSPFNPLIIKHELKKTNNSDTANLTKVLLTFQVYLFERYCCKIEYVNVPNPIPDPTIPSASSRFSKKYSFTIVQVT